MTDEQTPTDTALNEIDNLDESTAIRADTEDGVMIIWTLDDENVHALTKNGRGTWYPRPTIISHEMAAEILDNSEYEEIDPEEIPEDRHDICT